MYFHRFYYYFTFSHHINRNSVEIVWWSSSSYPLLWFDFFKLCHTGCPIKWRLWLAFNLKLRACSFFLCAFSLETLDPVCVYALLSACLKCMKFTASLCPSCVLHIRTLTLHGPKNVNIRCSGSVTRLLVQSLNNNAAADDDDDKKNDTNTATAFSPPLGLLCKWERDGGSGRGRRCGGGWGEQFYNCVWTKQIY